MRIFNTGDLAFAVCACGQLMVEELPPVGQDGRHRGVGGRGLGGRCVDHKITELVELVDGSRRLQQVILRSIDGRNQIPEVRLLVDGDVRSGRRGCQSADISRRLFFPATVSLKSDSHSESPSSDARQAACFLRCRSMPFNAALACGAQRSLAQLPKSRLSQIGYDGWNPG